MRHSNPSSSCNLFTFSQERHAGPFEGLPQGFQRVHPWLACSALKIYDRAMSSPRQVGKLFPGYVNQRAGCSALCRRDHGRSLMLQKSC